MLALFLMHGLTADHDMPAPMSAATSAQAAGEGHHNPARHLTREAHAPPGGQGALAESSRSSRGMESLDDLLTATGHGQHAMADLCLALLGTGVLLPILLGRRLPQRLNPLSGLLHHAVTGRAGVSGPSYLPAPSLHRLCILRT